ncbi:MAG: HD domain-containing protein [Acidaminococcaceae bacterium]|nr:HD domain-containing protein [Acidaminococcaceae bacterium]
MISELKAGMKFCQAAIVKVQRIGKSSNGNFFARGFLEDSSGSTSFVCFAAEAVDFLRNLETVDAFMVNGVVDINKYAGDNQSLVVIIHSLSNLLPEDDVSNLLPHGDFDLEQYKAKLSELIKSVKTPVLYSLLENIFSGAVYEQFVHNPAGTKMHHAYTGGLLQHSVDTAQLAVAMADKIGDVNKDLVIAGALLHDIGKLKEISSRVGFPYTDEGRLLGHIAISAMLIQETAARLRIPVGRIEQLLHIVLSHHGEQDKGSPIACATREAFIVHYADEVNAVMNQFETASGKNSWSFNKMLQRNIFIERV